MMHHVLKSSVSLQWLSEVFGKIRSYVNVYIFWLGKEASTKSSHSFFRYPRWKPHTLCEGFFREFLKEWMHLGEVPFVATGTCAASISVIHTSTERQGELQGRASRGVKLAEQLQPPFKWELMDIDNIVWIALQFSQWTLFLLRLLAAFSSCFDLCFSIFPFTS